MHRHHETARVAEETTGPCSACDDVQRTTTARARRRTPASDGSARSAEPDWRGGGGYPLHPPAFSWAAATTLLRGPRRLCKSPGSPTEGRRRERDDLQSAPFDLSALTRTWTCSVCYFSAESPRMGVILLANNG